MAVCLLAACSDDDGDGSSVSAGTTTTTRQAEDPAGLPPEQSSSTGTPTADSREPACEVELPASWQTALEDGAVLSEDGGELSVHLTLADRTQLRRMGPNAVRSALTWLPADGQERTVQNIAEIDWWAPVSGADSDGRYVAWSLVQWAGTEDETTRVYVWDSANEGPPLELGAGHVVGGPVIVTGAVVWVQGTDDPLQMSGLQSFDLTSGTARVLAAGYLGAPVVVGDTVLVADQPPEGTTGSGPRVHAVRPADTSPAVPAEESAAHDAPGDRAAATTAGPLDEPVGTPAPSVEEPGEIGELPTGLAEPAGGIGALAAEGDVVAWTDRAGERLFVWQVGEHEPWEAVELSTGGEGVGGLAVVDGAVAWTNPGQGAEQGRYLLDLDSSSYALVREGDSTLRSLGEQLLLGPVEDGAGLPSTIIEPASLPDLPGCAAGTG